MNTKNEDYTKRAAQLLAGNITRLAEKRVRLMEVCGTHTMSIFKSGIRRILPETVELVSGPGCPVCVTANDYLDTALAYAGMPDIIIATFGDMLKIPGSYSSLMEAKTTGADIRIVYSPLDALTLASANTDKRVIFLAVGFETTAPVVAATIKAARKEGVNNLYFLTAHKLVPPALTALLNKRQAKKIDGFLLPGHVCAITGIRDFDFLGREFKVPAVVTGFEPLDILEGIYLLVKEIAAGEPRLLNQYSRVVKEEGNKAALAAMQEVFRPAPANWRGLGIIEDSGLVLQEDYAAFDALKNLPVELLLPNNEPAGCRCGDVLTGTIHPPECPLFGGKCLPEHPVGACMVSTEGSCAAWYKYKAGRWQF